MRSLLLLPLLAACCTTPIADSASLPPFPTFPRETAGVNERIYLAAASYGRLALQGNCLGMTGSGGGFSTVVWPYTASLGRDARGLFVTDTDSGAKLRLGDWMIFGSGPTDGDTAYDSPLSEPVSAECRNRMIALSPGFDKHRRP
jgi:hypothetical protein